MKCGFLIFVLGLLPSAGFAKGTVSFDGLEGVAGASTARAPQDSTALAALDTKTDEYLAVLEREPVEVKCRETDFMISVCTDSVVLTHVANRVYDHYRSSRLMGDDAVAIHVYDTWFADKAVKMNSEEDYFDATFFATINRNSLIGCKAPKLELYTPENESFTIFGNEGRSGETVMVGNGETTYSILFFYDVGCPVCMAETAALRKVLEKYSPKLVLYAVYVGSDAEKWAGCRRDRFGDGSEESGDGSEVSGDGSEESGDGSEVSGDGAERSGSGASSGGQAQSASSGGNPAAQTIHLWDPEAKSTLAFDYGVIGTPRLFLISPDGTIVGRGLDSVALETLLDTVLGRETLEYGSQEAMDLYDRTFEGSEPCANVSEVAAHIEELLLPRGDTLLFKQMTGDLLYFLTGRKQARFKCASEAFIDEFILNRPDVWTTADDSLQVVSLAVFLKGLLNLCPLGEKLPPLEVPVEVLTRKGGKTTAELPGGETEGGSGDGAFGEGSTNGGGIKSKTTTLRLDRQKNCAVIFYTEGCGLCAKSLAGAENSLKSGTPVPDTEFVPSKIILIDMDEIWSMEGDLPDRLMQNFDLSSLPFILCLDGKGRTAYKYADFN